MSRRHGAKINGHLSYVSDKEILELIRGRLAWADLRDETIDSFFASGVLLRALHDVAHHHLALTVMGT